MHRIRPVPLMCLSLLVVGWHAPLTAQTVEGVVRDGQARQPIVLAEISLTDTVGTVIDRTVTDHNGEFLLIAPEPGAYLLMANAPGYRRVVDGVLDLAEGGYINVEVYLPVDPVAIAGLEVTVDRERARQYLEREGFYQRMNMGFGRFLSPTDIEQKAPQTHRSLFQGLPGVRMVDGYLGEDMLYLRDVTSETSAGYCTPDVYLDGGRVISAAGLNTNGVRMRDVADVTTIVGVEVYTRASSAPLQFRRLGLNCGVLLIWTQTSD